MSVFHIRRTAKSFNDACCRLLSLHGQVTSASIVITLMSGSVQASHSVTSNHVRFIHILFPHPSHAASSIQAALELFQARGSLFSAVPCYRQKDSRNAETSNRESDFDKSRYELVSHMSYSSVCPSAGTSNFWTDERKMTWEGHSI